MKHILASAMLVTAAFAAVSLAPTASADCGGIVDSGCSYTDCSGGHGCQRYGPCTLWLDTHRYLENILGSIDEPVSCINIA